MSVINLGVVDLVPLIQYFPCSIQWWLNWTEKFTMEMKEGGLDDSKTGDEALLDFSA